MELNFDDLTLGELCDIEEATGFSMLSIKADKDGTAEIPASALVAIAWVLKRRDEPDFTLEQARSLRVEELMDPTPNPTNGDS